ncbi:hypothetical protein [Vulcanisaeta distributa]|uniref:Uncharacterized protein n=1 Tax=Vulcanisaeta distributa (strain DSM 14429 / JCM 11212 / NBRC 100878 / IC-017) TaxID=572478 RepID=E1QRJ3_VULDI|nr:hypothetical protein [Vulcanisaeta distributa]ADN51807.1 hypothetical protein Vdis_2441 [Vulcanisaeta distributa DSM 14429]
MEFLAPLGSVNVGGRLLSNAKVSISDKYVFIIGIGPDGSYEERLLEINSDEARQVISNNKDYFNELLDKLDELIISIGREVNVNINVKNVESGDPIQYLMKRLNNHDEYLKLVGDGWRRVLDSTRLGKVSISLAGSDRIYVTHSGNNVTLNLVAEPIDGGVIEVITYTEGKVTGIVRVRVGEDVVVKVDIRSTSSLIILSQARDIDRLGSPFINLMPRVKDHVIKYVNEILDVMRRYGVIQ